jgi:hypothetical protein
MSTNVDRQGRDWGDRGDSYVPCDIAGCQDTAVATLGPNDEQAICSQHLLVPQADDRNARVAAAAEAFKAHLDGKR